MTKRDEAARRELERGWNDRLNDRWHPPTTGTIKELVAYKYGWKHAIAELLLNRVYGEEGPK